MTRRTDPSGQETITLGNFEKCVGAIAMALLMFIGYIVWSDHEAIAKTQLDIAVIQAHIQGGK